MEKNVTFSNAVPITRVSPAKSWSSVDFNEVWSYRNLLLYLVWRDIKVIFTRTGLGIFWVVLQPLSTVIVVSIVLGIFVKVPTENIPYPVLVLSGLVPWTYFSNVVLRASASMLGNAHLITKVYFPRVIIPLAPVLTCLVDFAVLLAVLLVLSLFNGFYPNIRWLLLPVFILLTVGISLGFSLWVSPLNVKYRDIGNLLPVILQIGVYASPILYLSQLVPVEWLWLYRLNPMVGIIEGIRWILLNTTSFPFYSVTATLFFVLASTTSGFFLFKKMEDVIADLV